MAIQTIEAPQLIGTSGESLREALVKPWSNLLINMIILLCWMLMSQVAPARIIFVSISRKDFSSLVLPSKT